MKRTHMALFATVAVAALAVGCKPSAKKDALPAGAVPITSSEPAVSAPSPISPPALTGATVMVAGHEAPSSFAPIAKHADPSVVTITTVSEESDPPGFFSRGRHRETHGLGTGFIVDGNGTILTNNHVVSGADQVVVQLSNGHPYPAKVQGRDASTDIAVVKIESKEPLLPLALGDSDAAEVGDWVVAIGNPFGLSHTVSVGIVSAKGRTREDVPLDPSGYYDFLQTDASINPGNSGGPLLNLRGEVVGMNTAVRGGGAQGIGFAIPINMVRQLLPMLEHDGRITRSALGVRIRDVKDLSPEQKSEIKYDDEKGAVIEALEPNAAAAKAGLQPGDVIVAFEGKPIESHKLLQWLASTAGVGKTVTVRVIRGGKAFDQKVTLEQLPQQGVARTRHRVQQDEEP